MTSHTWSERGRFGGFWRKAVELSSTSREDGWLSLARRSQASGLVVGATRLAAGGGDGKVIKERLCISLPYVETFNSNVIKGFVTELRSRYVFFVFRDSYVLCIYVMNIICTFHISVSWVWYTIDIIVALTFQIFLAQVFVYLFAFLHFQFMVHRVANWPWTEPSYSSCENKRHRCMCASSSHELKDGRMSRALTAGTHGRWGIILYYTGTHVRRLVTRSLRSVK